MSDEDRSSASKRLPIFLLVGALLIALGVAFMLGGLGLRSKVPNEIQARGRAAAFFHKDQMEAARAELALLVVSDTPSLDVLCDAAAIEFAAGNYDGARAILDHAEALAPEAPRVTFLRAQLLRGAGDYEEALPYFERTHANLPDDLPTLLCLADVQHGLDRPLESTLR